MRASKAVREHQETIAIKALGRILRRRSSEPSSYNSLSHDDPLQEGS
jgi:hypothetical protein